MSVRPGEPASRCQPLPGVGPSRLVGDPVDIVTGAVLDNETDFRLPRAPVPLTWARYYDSSRAASDRGIGRGFRHALDHELRFDLDGMTYSDPTGAATSFPFLQRDGELRREPALALERVNAQSYRVHLPEGRVLEFGFPKQSTVARLDSVREQAKLIQLHYEPRSLQLQAVSLGALGRLRVEWSVGRIASLALVEAEPEREQTVALYRYDADGCLVEARNAYKHSLKYAFDSTGRLVRKTDRRGYSFLYAYDAAGRCVDSRGEDGAEAVELEYRPIERATIVTRHDGGKWVYQYTDFGAITRVLDPCGGMHAFIHDDAGRVTSEIDPLGNETRVIYDEHGAPRAKIDPCGHRLPLNHATNAPGPRADRLARTPLEYHYGVQFVAERLPAAEDPLWEVAGEARNAIRTADPTWGGKIIREYSVLGLPLRDRKPDDRTRRWALDENGNVRWVIDFDGSKRTFDYVSDNQRAQVTDALGASMRFERASNGVLTALTDPGGTRSEYARDLKDRIVEVRRHGRVRERYAYDPADNLIEKRDANAELLITRTIGAGNLEAGRALSSGEMQTFNYDARGRMTAACGAAGSCRFAYTDAGELAEDLRDGLGVVHTQRWSRGQTCVLERFVTHTRRSGLNKLAVHDPTGREHELRRVASGVFERRLAGATEISQFDSEGRCLSKVLYRAREAHESAWVRSFEYSAQGDLIARRDSERGLTRYFHDAAHRLQRVEHAGGQVETYAYDFADNLVRMPSPFLEARRLDQGQRLELQSGNRLLEVGGERFHYDHRDHVVRRERAYGNTYYHRDALDQLIGITGPDLAFSAGYDALGRRTHKTVRDQETTYYWDGDRLAAEVLPSGAVRVYIYAAPRAMVPWMFVDYASRDAHPESGQWYGVVSDHLGAVELILDAAGATVWRARLDPYGLAFVEIGQRFHQPLRFPGHFFDTETRLHYNRFRYYDPAIGRYLESDPLGIQGGANLYAYTRNPLGYVDLRGLSTDCPDGVDCPLKQGRDENGRPLAEGAMVEDLYGPGVHIEEPNTKRAPVNDGFWEGQPGDGLWWSDKPEVNAATDHKPIPFKDGYPDFGEFSKGNVGVKQTGDNDTDFRAADKAFAKQQGWEKPNGQPDTQRAKEYRKDGDLTWHHHQDGTTMQLVPQDIHGNTPHEGGASGARAGDDEM